MTLTYDLYWSFRSPYSYMVMPRLAALERDHDVACQVRPPGPMSCNACAYARGGIHGKRAPMPPACDGTTSIWWRRSHFWSVCARRVQTLQVPS